MKDKIEINGFGDKFWRNSEGKLHREDGPAIEYATIDGIILEDRYFLNDKEYSKESHKKILIRRKIDSLRD